MTGYIIPSSPCISPKATVTAKAADVTLTVANFGAIITSTGAVGIPQTSPWKSPHGLS